jgi:hypothetical protein
MGTDGDAPWILSRQTCSSKKGAVAIATAGGGRHRRKHWFARSAAKCAASNRILDVGPSAVRTGPGMSCRLIPISDMRPSPRLATYMHTSCEPGSQGARGRVKGGDPAPRSARLSASADDQLRRSGLGLPTQSSLPGARQCGWGRTVRNPLRRWCAVYAGGASRPYVCEDGGRWRVRAHRDRALLSRSGVDEYSSGV